MQPEKRKRIAFYIYYAGLLLLVASLPLSKFTMSIAQFMIAAGWLMDGNYSEKLKKFFSPGLPLLVASIYLLHLTGLINTSDFSYAWKDLRIKLPLLILPFLLATGPQVNRQQFRGILLAVIGGVLISTLISVLIYAGIVDRPVNDIRDISIFISHIRLSLLCCMSIFSCIWLMTEFRKSRPGKYYLLFIPVILWLMSFMILLESLTGLSIIIITGLLLINILLFQHASGKAKILVLGISISIPAAVGVYIFNLNKSFNSKHKIDLSELDTTTISGNAYQHFYDREDLENGNYVWMYLCEKELEVQWNLRSRIDYGGKDQRNQEIKYTLIRFLTSKGLRKDSAGVWSLSADEVHSIEKGITNVNFQGAGNIRGRLYQVLWELHNYKTTGDPSGHSVAQRLEFWKASLNIIRQHLFFGVGTGDVPDAFKNEYRHMETKLKPEWQLRSHNQYLSIAIAFGIPGLLWFMYCLVYPLVQRIRKLDYLYFSFSMISILSMCTEDTLETQAGVTFFALFNCLFLFVNPTYSSTDGK